MIHQSTTYVSKLQNVRHYSISAKLEVIKSQRPGHIRGGGLYNMPMVKTIGRSKCKILPTRK